MFCLAQEHICVCFSLPCARIAQKCGAANPTPSFLTPRWYFVQHWALQKSRKTGHVKFGLRKVGESLLSMVAMLYLEPRFGTTMLQTTWFRTQPIYKRYVCALVSCARRTERWCFILLACAVLMCLLVCVPLFAYTLAISGPVLRFMSSHTQMSIGSLLHKDFLQLQGAGLCDQSHTFFYMPQTHFGSSKKRRHTHKDPMSCRLLLHWMCGVVCQLRYSFVWLLSEASLTFMGLNLKGWDEKGKPIW